MKIDHLPLFAKIFTVLLLLTVMAPFLQAHVLLQSPNGGEVLDVGSTYTINWKILIQHPTQNWDLSYSTTGSAGPWISIVTDLPTGDPSTGSIHTYDWTVPDTLSDQVRVRVYQDNSGPDYFDDSAADLSIAYLAMEAGPNPISTGQTLTIQTDGASLQGAIAALVIVDVDGSPEFTPVLFGNMGAQGSWTIVGTVPPGLTGLSITVRTYAKQGLGDVRFSNDQVIVFQ